MLRKASAQAEDLRRHAPRLGTSTKRPPMPPRHTWQTLTKESPDLSVNDQKQPPRPWIYHRTQATTHVKSQHLSPLRHLR